MEHYKELKIWQKPMDLVKKIHISTSLFLNNENYGLIGQILRSAISIPSNIAEGAVRNSSKDFRNFLGIANGLTNEPYTQLTLSVRIGCIEEIQKINFTLIKKFSNL